MLGVLRGIVGVCRPRRREVLLGIGEPLIGRLLTYDALGMRSARSSSPRPRLPALRRGPDHHGPVDSPHGRRGRVRGERQRGRGARFRGSGLAGSQGGRLASFAGLASRASAGASTAACGGSWRAWRDSNPRPSA